MYSFILENSKGDQLKFNELGGAFTITEIQGLNPPNAQINTSEAAMIDGQLFDSSKLEARDLNIAFAIERDAAENRIQVYRVLKTKQPVRAYYKNEYRDVYIDGYVRSVDIAYYDMKQIVTVSIVCPQPYLQNAEIVVSELSAIVNMFHFPFASPETPKEILFGYLDPTANVEIINDGDVATGLTIVLFANAPVANPKIIDYITGDFIALNYAMQADDQITITTSAGNKTITLLRNGVESNLFNSLAANSTWLQLDYGGGVYAYEVGSGNAADLVVTINHTNIYEGV